MSVYGPILTYPIGITFKTAYMYRISYRQKPISSSPLPFEMESIVVKVASGGGIPNRPASDYSGWAGAQTDGYASSRNLCYSRFKGKVSENAELLVNLIQRRKAIDMITKRVVQLTRFVKAFKSGRFGDASAALNLTGQTERNSNARARLKKSGGLRLEIVYGWKPLIKDIATAVELLQSPYPRCRVVARARSTGQLKIDSPWNYSPNYMLSGTWRCHMQANISVSNPNLFLANQLGFVNPASVVWELIPFSFIVDWFSNIGDFLASFTDFVGLNLEQAFTTMTHPCSYTETWNGYSDWIADVDLFFCQRVSGIPGPTIEFEKDISKILSPSRAANAVALLLQALDPSQK